MFVCTCDCFLHDRWGQKTETISSRLKHKSADQVERHFMKFSHSVTWVTDRVQMQSIRFSPRKKWQLLYFYRVVVKNKQVYLQLNTWNVFTFRILQLYALATALYYGVHFGFGGYFGQAISMVNGIKAVSSHRQRRHAKIQEREVNFQGNGPGNNTR